MECRVIRAFPFSRDGITVENVEVGAIVDMPDHIVPGLIAAGYIEKKSMPAAPENAASAASPENKRRGRPRNAG